MSAAYDYPLLIKNLLHTPLQSAPDQEIVYADISRYTYRTFADRIGSLASALSQLGVKQGDTVAVMDWDSHRYLECFFAVPMMGAVLHTINIRLSPDQILYTIDHAEDDMILVHQDFLPLLAKIANRIRRAVTFVLLAEESSMPELPENFSGEYESLLRTGDPEFEFPEFDEHTQATCFYTTGTTGDPKGVSYSHRQLVLHTLGTISGFAPIPGDGGFNKGDVYMPITPMFHVHGWGFPYVATLLGVKQVYPGQYDPAKLLNLIVGEGVTFSHCVPTILTMLLNVEGVASMDLSRWKVIIGGSALPQGLAKMALDLGMQVYAAYGLSETCPVLTVADLRLTGSDSDSVAARCKTGQPVPMVELRIVDQQMNEVPHDGQSTGEVVARSPWLTRGYIKNPQASQELWRGGYLHTGDIGYIEPSGSLQITDRIKDVIKSGGEWISSLQLENIVSACEGVNEVAAIGIPDQRWGERPMLLVVRSSEITAEEIILAISVEVEKGRLSKWATPDRIEFVEQLDKTSVGKLDKKLMRARYAVSDVQGG
ncbi:MAG: fatty acid--CoA ligase [Proteobacteria bacterium]|nr:fatty acid--CoA ligase [Pseudomonadota bacterium]